GFAGDGGPATSASLNGPTEVAVTPEGGFLIADNSNRRIRRVAPDGIITTVAGDGTTGSAGDGGPATAAQLNGPVAVDVDAAGNYLIADAFNPRIRRVEGPALPPAQQQPQPQPQPQPPPSPPPGADPSVVPPPPRGG